MDAQSLIAKSFNLSSKTADTDYIGFDGIFKADARSNERETGKSTVANFYVEDGSQVSDHIIVDARVLNISGEIAEVTYQRDLLTSSYTRAREEIGNISAYIPNTTLSQVNTIGKYVNTAANTKRLVDDNIGRINRFGNYTGDILGNDSLKNVFFKNNESIESKQAQFIKFIRTYHQLKKTMKVETLRYGIFENMVITNYSFTQVDDNYFAYSIDFQEIRFVKTIVTNVKNIAKNPSGTQAKVQTSSKQDKGVVQGTDVKSTSNGQNKNASLLSKIFG